MYNRFRTHLSLGKDAPFVRPVRRVGNIAARPILGGLHHEYCGRSIQQGQVGLALLSPSAAHAQESSRLSAEYLRQATPLIHWPQGLEPQNVDVFVHNEGWIDAPPEVVWGNLVDATQWPSWYSNCADVKIDGGQPRLAQGVGFNWQTFGFLIRSTVDVFEPNREIGWSVDKPQFRVHHAWLLVPERGGTRVITEEAQKGADAIRFRLEQPNAMYDGHDWWMSALKARAERTAQR